MTEKRFDVVMNEFDEVEYITDIVDCEDRDFADFIEFANEMAKENEELKQFQDSVFSWIDMHLQRLPTLRDDEFESDNEFAEVIVSKSIDELTKELKLANSLKIIEMIVDRRVLETSGAYEQAKEIINEYFE